MASVGGLSLSTFRDGGPAASAASFDLVRAPHQDHCRTFSAAGWEAEVRKGLKRVVFRSKIALGEDEIVDEAIPAVQQFLDLVSVIARDHMLPKMAADVNILMFRRDSSIIVQHRDVVDFGMMVALKAEIRNAQGEVTQLPPPPEPQWSPAFRYYRLSQTSRDLFEAYRNLFLATEAVLSGICPKNAREHEKGWLTRALSQIANRVDLSPYSPSGQDPIGSIVLTQYQAIRCELFHAKPDSSILPHELPSQRQVTIAYEQLLQLWEDIARTYLSVRLPSGGLTYHGFRFICDEVMPKLKMWMTADDTPFDAAEIEMSPKGYPVHPFATHQYLGEQHPGRAALVAGVPVVSLPNDQVVGRVAGTFNGTAGIVSHISGGLSLEGTSELETLQVMRLVNPQSPMRVFQ